MGSIRATVSTTDETSANYETLTVQITEEEKIDTNNSEQSIAMWTDLQNKIDVSQEDIMNDESLYC